MAETKNNRCKCIPTIPDIIRYKLTGFSINSLLDSDAIWWHRAGSTLAQAMACCLMSPGHWPQLMLTYHRKYFVAFTQEQLQKCSWTSSVTWVQRLHFLKFHPHLPGANELMPNRLICHVIFMYIMPTPSYSHIPFIWFEINFIFNRLCHINVRWPLTFPIKYEKIKFCGKAEAAIFWN